VSEIQSYPNYPQSSPRFYKSTNKKPGSALVVFVHFFGGHQRILKRHIQLVNELGYDAFAFNMPARLDLSWRLLFSSKFGLKHLYSRMLDFYLDQIEGRKIVFSFSNPSASAIESIANRLDKNDITALICDSGPSGKFMRSAWNLAIQQQKNPYLMIFFSFFWSLKFHADIKNQLSLMPVGFPILSIQPIKDPVIPPDHIQSIFKTRMLAGLKTYQPQEAGHLNALKINPEEYRKHLQDFLDLL
jgi:hypothetical protein